MVVSVSRGTSAPSIDCVSYLWWCHKPLFGSPSQGICMGFRMYDDGIGLTMDKQNHMGNFMGLKKSYQGFMERVRCKAYLAQRVSFQRLFTGPASVMMNFNVHCLRVWVSYLANPPLGSSHSRLMTRDYIMMASDGNKISTIRSNRHRRKLIIMTL